MNPNSIRTVNPSAWPQYPFNEPPKGGERSEPRYTTFPEYDLRITMRDGVRLAADVFRPWAPDEKFPALIGYSPYTRQLQHTLTPIGQNESGLTEFWVPRGYAHVIVDVRGSNDSEGLWDYRGSVEQQDLAEVIAWVASRPWCNGKVGMHGCSYFAVSQVLVASSQQPTALKAIFPYDAYTDQYRYCSFHGGIPADGFMRIWFSDVAYLNLWGGRLKEPAGLHHHFRTILGNTFPLDGEYWRDRSSDHRLDRIKIPAYFGCDWPFFNLHLPGAFRGWEGTSGIPKRMLIGPHPHPRRPFGVYHQEALRWYDHWLKGMDTRVMEGAPIQLWIQGDDTWRSEWEWPLARTEWREMFLGGSAGGREGRLLDAAGPDNERSYAYYPSGDAAWIGQPNLVYRSEPVVGPLEITGPIVLHLVARSTATDTDWFVIFADEAPDGTVTILTRGWLRSSHREVDPTRSKPYSPYRPHARQIPLTPNQQETMLIEIIPTCNVFQPGHRIRLEIASSDNMVDNPFWYHRALSVPATNTVSEGKAGSRLVLPIIPR